MTKNSQNVFGIRDKLPDDVTKIQLELSAEINTQIVGSNIVKRADLVYSVLRGELGSTGLSDIRICDKADNSTKLKHFIVSTKDAEHHFDEIIATTMLVIEAFNNGVITND